MGSSTTTKRRQPQKQTQQHQSTNGTSRVWVRLDIVETIIEQEFPDNCPPLDWKFSSAASFSTNSKSSSALKKQPSRQQVSHKKQQQNDPFAWGWARAKVIPQEYNNTNSNSTESITSSSNSSSSSPPKSPFGNGKLRKVQNSVGSSNKTSPSWKKKSPSSSSPITIMIDDSEYAPSYLQNVKVTLPSLPAGEGEGGKEGPFVYMANSWWQQQQQEQSPSNHQSNGTTTTRDEPPQDLTTLTHLHEPAVVCCLKRRYEQDLIYTYTGKILLALNPFRICNHLYGQDIMKHYWACQGEPTTNVLVRPPPHIYAVAQDAYSTMMRAMQMTLSPSSQDSHHSEESSFSQVCLNQSILVSGESGAGKTVTTKIIMRYLATLSKSQATTTASTSCNATTPEAHKEDFSIESQVLQSNPILESFGNARTVRNDNSSRFGKYIEIQFQSTGSLVCASIETYLLEKVRLITQAPGERNYHIFYELLSSSSSGGTSGGGPSVSQKRQLHILDKTPQDFKMTNQSNTFDRRDGVTDSETFHSLKKALDTIGFTPKEQMELYTVACALLHASNLTFTAAAAANGDSNTTNYGRNSSDGDDESALDRTNSSLKPAVELLGVSSCQVLNDALCTCAIEARGETLFKNLSISQAEKALQALIKATYGALFSYIVDQVNKSIFVRREQHERQQQQQQQQGQDNDHHSYNNSSKAATAAACIGVLDIFGFESFDQNSFEQLCINYCNEALQQQFNKFVFKLEQQEYEREGIEWSFITFPDNQDVLDLIDKKHTGILSLLDEQCRVPRSSDKAYARATYEKCARHERFHASPTQKVSCTFTIYHYAGPVEYDTMNFIEKNKDELPKESTDLLLSSSHPLVPVLGRILREPSANSNNSSNNTANPSAVSSSSSAGSNTGRPRPLHRVSSSIMRESVGSQFCSQLRKLRDRIDETTPHYVRCLKPNDELVPYNFNPLIIADQLRCAGVLEAIRVSRVGFPQRYTHGDFIQRYRILAIREMEKISERCSGWDLCEQLVKSLAAGVAHMLTTTATSEEGQSITDADLQLHSIASNASRQPYDPMAVGIQMGKTKVFLRRQAFDCLELLRNKKVSEAAVVIQKNSRRHLAVYYLQLSRLAVIIIQSFARQVNAKRQAQSMMKYRSAVTIQCAWRRYKAHHYFSSIVYLSSWCQSKYRGARCRRMFTILLRDKKSIVIQRNMRRHIARKRYNATMYLALQLQCLSRVKRARHELAQKKREARDFGVVAAERDRLRSEAANLRKQLEEAKRKQISPIPENASASDVQSSKDFQLQHEINGLQRSPPQSCIEGEESSASAMSMSQSEVSEQYEHLLRQKEQEIQQLKQEVASLQCNSSVSSLSMNDHIYRAQPPFSDERQNRAPPSPNRLGLLKMFSPTRFLRMRENSKQDVSQNVVSLSPAEEEATKSPSSISLLDIEEDFLDGIMNGVDVSDSLVKSTIGTSSRHVEGSLKQTDKHQHHLSNLDNGQFLPNKELILHETVSGGSKQKLEKLLQTLSNLHIKINEGDLNGKTPLHLAALSSDFDIVEMLLENDAIANSQDSEGNTPLHLASTGPITALLLEKGKAKPNIPNLDGVCALHVAVGRKDEESVEHILKYGACVNSADDINWFTPLHLVAQGGDTTDENLDQYSQKLCSMTGRKRIADLLCSASEPSEPDLDYQDVEGNTPLHHAAVLPTEDARDLFGLFLDRGANPNVSNKRGQASIHLLCHNESLRKHGVIPEMLDLLLFHGADPNLPTKTGCTPLHLSLYNQDTDSAVLLVNGGAELHNLWKIPRKWDVFWDGKGEDVLALDMVQEEHSLHRILSAIIKPQKKAPMRSWCMQCNKSPCGTAKPTSTVFSKMTHCQHCGRWVCGFCVQHDLPAEFFPKTFEMAGSGCVCVICEKILVCRKEDDGNTQPTTSIDEDDRVSFQDSDKSHRLIVGPESGF